MSSVSNILLLQLALQWVYLAHRIFHSDVRKRWSFRNGRDCWGRGCALLGWRAPLSARCWDHFIPISKVWVPVFLQACQWNVSWTGFLGQFSQWKKFSVASFQWGWDSSNVQEPFIFPYFPSGMLILFLVGCIPVIFFTYQKSTFVTYNVLPLGKNGRWWLSWVACWNWLGTFGICFGINF